MLIGKVIGGSVNEGVRAILNPEAMIENYPIGSLVIIESNNYSYLGIIINAGISSSQSLSKQIITPHLSKLMKEILIKETNGSLWNQWIELALLAQTDGAETYLSDTMPNFSSVIRDINENDVKLFFGRENQIDIWSIGVPKTSGKVNLEIPIDIKKLVNLSFGIFGKSGSGKTFLGNLIAGYMILYDLLASGSVNLKLLIFDMHSEYSLELKDNLGNPIEDGVGKIFKEWVKRYTPDCDLARERGLSCLGIDITNLTVSDLELIAPIFGLSERFIQYLRDFKKIIENIIGTSKYWVIGILPHEKIFNLLRQSNEGKELLDKLSERGISDPENLSEIVSKRIKEKYGIGAVYTYKSQVAKLSRLLDYPLVTGSDVMDEIVSNLTREDGSHIIISLGKFEKEVPLYMLIANIIARKLRERISEKSLRGEELETKIIIFLEEAHNFLGRETYRISPFGVIAREMRKKGVILCVIDQRPSELDTDVISMLWTNFVLSLTDPRDISIALMGAPRAELFNKIIPLLRTREVFIYGQAINFPVVIKIRDYSRVALFFKKKVREILSAMDTEVKGLKESGFL